MKALYITPYHFWENFPVVHNGFSYIKHLLPGHNFFFLLGKTDFEMMKDELFSWSKYPIDLYKKKFESFDKIFVTINHSQLVDYFRPLMDERWVIGGAFFEAFGTNFDYDCPAQFWGGTFEEYLGVPLSTTFTDYFHSYFNHFPQVHYTVSIGAGCSANSNCLICTEKNIPHRTRGNISDTYLNLKKYSKGSSIFSGISSVMPDQIKEIVTIKKQMNVDYVQIYTRTDPEVFEVLKPFEDLSGIRFLIGIEALTQSGVDRFGKCIDLAFSLDMISDIVKRGGFVSAAIQREPYLDDDELAQAKSNANYLFQKTEGNSNLEICFSRPEPIWYGEENCKYPTKKRIELDDFFAFTKKLNMFTEVLPDSIANNNKNLQIYLKELGFITRHIVGYYKNRPW